jgi:hypothetical protein
MDKLRLTRSPTFWRSVARSSFTLHPSIILVYDSICIAGSFFVLSTRSPLGVTRVVVGRLSSSCSRYTCRPCLLVYHHSCDRSAAPFGFSAQWPDLGNASAHPGYLAHQAWTTLMLLSRRLSVRSTLYFHRSDVDALDHKNTQLLFCQCCYSRGDLTL